MKRSAITILLILAALLSACGLSPTPPLPDLAQIVAQTQTAVAQNPPPTQPVVQPQPLPTDTQTIPTATPSEIPPTPTFTVSPSPTQTSTPEGPTPTATCLDRARFISESIPDDTVFNPGQKFNKTWKLRNIGSCTWTEKYTAVLTSGELLGAPQAITLTVSVTPNSDLEIGVQLIAPDQPGTYRGEWKLRNDRNEIFGLGKDATDPFWVQIKVVETNAGLDLGTPVWTDGFDKAKDPNWDLGSDGYVKLEVEDGSMLVTALQPSGDQWRVALRPEIGDFFLQGTFKTGASCSGKDSYGLLVRAPDSNDSNIDSGYLFGFACDGTFRVYRMDNGTFNNILSWTSSANLLAGVNVENKIGILAQGDNYKVFVNDVVIYEFTDPTYAKGLFGVLVRAGDSEQFKFSLDSISYWNVP